MQKLLPANRDLLNLAQERNWIPLLLGWLNLHDRPAVQVEALLALTNIAELCAQHSFSGSWPAGHGTGRPTVEAVAAAAAAAADAAKAVSSSLSQGTGTGSNSSLVPGPEGDSQVFNFSALLPSNQGSVPFPPLSFSQTMPPEALAAFDTSLSSTIQQAKSKGQKGSKSSSFNLPGAPFSSNLGSTSNSFNPPPTPPSNQDDESSSFPQQLSASSQNLLLRHADAIPTLISLLASPNKEVFEQAMWILGSIASGDSTGSNSGNSSSNSSDGVRDKAVAARDVILAAGVMKPLLLCLESHPTNLSLQRIGSWTLSNLVEGIFQQPSHGKSGSKGTEYSSSDEIEMDSLLPVLKGLLNMADAEVLSYTCWTLSHLCDGPSSHISAVVTTQDQKAPRGGLVPRLVELLGHSSWRVTKPALRTIGNIVCAECSDDNNHSSSSPTDYTEVILDCNAVPKLKELVTHSNREIQKEACWTLSNIAAGTVDQIQSVIDAGAIAPLVKLVSSKGTDQEVRSEACWVVLNATSCGSDAQIEVLVDEGCVSVLGVLLGEASMVMMALEGLERVLQVEEAREVARKEAGEETPDEETATLVSASLIEKALDSHNNSAAVTKRASRIWKQHFVSCALCHKSFSKHRTHDATFCEECKCHVCSNCDCQIYHLSYQEELWAATEEQTEAKKNAKKSKKAKKKEKQKQKKAKQDQVQFSDIAPTDAQRSSGREKEAGSVLSRSSTVNSEDNGGIVPRKTMNSVAVSSIVDDDERNPKSRGGSTHSSDAEEEDMDDDDVEAGEEDQNVEQRQPPIDFVLYLQQTGSIIALAKLMDALGYDGEGEEIDDVELQKLRQEHTGSVLNDPASY
jgi:hypothetical protein